MAIVAGGGTASLGFFVGVVARYVGPRIETLKTEIEGLRERVGKLEEATEKTEDRLTAARVTLNNELTAKITHGHDRINPLEALPARIDSVERRVEGVAISCADMSAKIARIEGRLSAARRRNTNGGE